MGAGLIDAELIDGALMAGSADPAPALLTGAGTLVLEGSSAAALLGGGDACIGAAVLLGCASA
jgi:hypothetical protein